MSAIYILGKQYDLSGPQGQVDIMDAIDEAKKREAAGDLSMIAYGLLNHIVKRELENFQTEAA